ncbi:MAG: bifunctional riboflavin kinase/FAD synthetase [Candidatus Fimimorpha sp.]
MIHFWNTSNIQITGNTAVTLGKFDGLHKGHQKLLNDIKKKKECGYQTVVFTFARPPMTLLTGKPQRTLLINEERREFLEAMQIDYLIEYPFNETVSHMSPEYFVEEILVNQLHMKYLAAGKDFGFGYKRSGNTDLLKALAPKYGYEITVMEKETDGKREISSTYIKEELVMGHMKKVEQLLGRPFSIQGKIVHGKALGRRIGIPTINIIPPDEKLLPPRGVYCAKVEIEHRFYDGIANIGVKPTVTDQKNMTVEVHLFDIKEELYGEDAIVFLYEFVRPEQKFESVEALKAQMERDIAAGKRYADKEI